MLANSSVPSNVQICLFLVHEPFFFSLFLQFLYHIITCNNSSWLPVSKALGRLAVDLCLPKTSFLVCSSCYPAFVLAFWHWVVGYVTTGNREKSKTMKFTVEVNLSWCEFLRFVSTSHKFFFKGKTDYFKWERVFNSLSFGDDEDQTQGLMYVKGELYHLSYIPGHDQHFLNVREMYPKAKLILSS